METPASFRAIEYASSALSRTFVVGTQPLPIILLSLITTAFVVVDPESIPAVSPV
jgi:hypothetical protein